MAGKAAVPKFGSWDAENIGYTVFFEKVRENKTAPVPATPTAAPNDYEFDPYEHYENLSRKAASRPPSSQGGRSHPAPPPAPHYYEDAGSRNAPSRPPSSQGHGHPAPAPPPPQHYYEDQGSRNVPSRPPSSQGYGHPAPPQQHYPGQHGSGGYHRRNGSNGSSAASEVSSRASKFSPPRPYQPRYSGNSGGSYHQPQPQYAAPEPRHYQQHAPPAPRVAASPPRHAPPPANERRPLPQVRAAKAPSAVPKFGVWDEQNAAAAAQGFTRQFEQVKRHREVAKVAAPDVPSLPRQQSPERTAPTWGRPPRKAKKSFLSKVYGCLFPVVRQ